MKPQQLFYPRISSSPSFALLIASLVVHLFAFVQPGYSWQIERPTEELAVRLAMLNADSFEIREKVTKELSNAESFGIMQIGQAFRTGSSEQKWRLLNVLENRAMNSTIEEFYRNAAALRVLANRRFGFSEVSAMKKLWNANARERAIAMLIEKGAIIQDVVPFGENDAALKRSFSFRSINGPDFQNRIIIDGFGNIAPAMDPEEEATRPESPDDVTVSPPLNFDELSQQEKEEILQEIPSMDLNRLRDLAMQMGPGESGQQPFSGPTPFSDDFFGQSDLAAVPFMKSITIGSDWTGTIDDLAILDSLATNISVRIVSTNQSLVEKLESLARSGNLQTLSLIDLTLGDAELMALSQMKQLKTLEIDLTRVSGDWGKSIAALPELKQLRLIGNSETVPEFEAVSRTPSLRLLSLYAMELEKENFLQLERAPSLVEVCMAECKFDAAEIGKARARSRAGQNREIKWVIAGTAFLGVRGPTILGDDNGVCRISEVVFGAPAAVAGVEPGDIIESLDSMPVKSFEDLIDIVSQKKPGEEIRIQIDRFGKTIRTTAVLGALADAPPR